MKNPGEYCSSAGAERGFVSPRLLQKCEDASVLPGDLIVLPEELDEIIDLKVEPTFFVVAVSTYKSSVSRDQYYVKLHVINLNMNGRSGRKSIYPLYLMKDDPIYILSRATK